jgi:bacillithiol biosynthesis deacetylase BshB1
VVAGCDVVAFGAHPDDVELGCGATLSRLVAAGRRVGIVDVTAGEVGTRGNATRRAAEAAAAAGQLRVAWRICLELADAGLAASDEAQRCAVAGVLRRARPRVVFLPHWSDPHPDHGATGWLLRHASFLAGVKRWHPELGPPHRPRLLLAYPGPRQLLEPQLVVDVTASYAAKRAALAAYASQFEPGEGNPTHLASGYFLAAIEGRDRAVGNTVGCELGEGFAPVGPVSADEVAWLVGEGPCALV